MYGCNFLMATSTLDPKELTKPFWCGTEKREGVRVGERDGERDKWRREAQSL